MTSTDNHVSLDPRENEPAAVKILREKMGGGLFLVGTVLFTLQFLISIVNLFVSTTTQYYEINQLLYQISGGEFMLPIGSGLDVVALVLGLLGHIFPMIVLIGLWCAFGAARSRKSPLGTGGLTAIRVVAIIELILTCIGAGIAALIMVLVLVAIIGGSAYGMEAGMEALFGSIWLAYFLSLVVVVATITLSICYCAAASGTLKKLKYTARTGLPGKPVSMFLIVMNILGFIASLVGFVFSLMGRLAFLNLGTFLTIGSELFSMLSMLLLTVALLSYRSAIRRANIPNVFPTAPAAPQTWEPAPAAPVYEQAPVFNATLVPDMDQPMEQPAPQPEPAPVQHFTPNFAEPEVPAQPVQEEPAPVAEETPVTAEEPTQMAPAVEEVPVTADEPTRLAPEPARPKARFCTQCGASLPENAIFCSNCGNKL